MKSKWLWIGGLLFGLMMLGPKPAYAISESLWISSRTITADSTKNLCMDRRAILHGVCISSATATAGASVIIYASSAAATVANTIATIDSMAKGCYYYDVYSSTPTGITYTTNSPGADTIFMYMCY